MNITKVTTDGVYYTDDNKCNLFLSFKECNKNWLAYRKRTENLSEEQIESLNNKDKTVGQRNADSDEIFIEFFTRPFLKVNFKLPEQKIEYEKFRDLIWEFGWSTNDLS